MERHMHDHAGEHDQSHEADDYATWIVEQRAAKDAFFSQSPHSPIPAAERAAFDHLSYFDVDRRFRFAALALGPVPSDVPVETQVQTSDGDIRDGRRAGVFTFVINAVEQHLTALQLAGSDGASLFVPFTDATTGAQTYEAGRYLDLEPGHDGHYDLDFNLAYAPFCAYSPHYSCPLPPPENRLRVAITAGERDS